MRRPLLAASAALAATTAVASAARAASAGSLAAGLAPYTDTYTVEHPYDVPASARMSVAGGVYTAWILQGDKPHEKGNTTAPRTEMRWLADWTGGDHLWEADVKIDQGTDHTCVMQVKVDGGPGEALFIQVKNGNLYDGANTVLARNVIGYWFDLAASYDPDTHVARVWVNGSPVLTTTYTKPAGTRFFFKNGVYNLSGARSETHFRHLTFWAPPPPATPHTAGA